MLTHRWLLLLLLLAQTTCSHQHTLRSWAIARDPTWYPLDLGQHTANINAFTNALVQAINKNEKVDIQLREENWDDLLLQLRQQQIDGVLTSMTPLPMYQDVYDFSDPFLLLGPVLVVPAHVQVLSLEDLSNKFIGVNQFDDSVLIVQAYPDILIEEYQSIPQALEALAAGHLDALLVPTLDAQALVPHLYPGILKIASPPLNDKGLRLMTIKNSYPKLIEHFNRGLETTENSGLYHELRAHFAVY